MLVVAGEFRIDPDKRAEAVSAAVDMMAATRDEDGCVAYVFSEDLEEPGLFRVFEEWETAEALEAHFVTPHMAEFRSRLADVGITHRIVHRYEVSSISLL